MRLRTECKILFLFVLLLQAVRTSAYSVAGVYPAQEFIINTGETTASSLLGDQAKTLAELNIVIAPVNYEVSEMRKWEKRYNKYLEDASYIVSSLQAGTTIYTQAFCTLRNLVVLTKAMRENPEGIISTSYMNNLYVTTAVKFLKVFRTLKEVCKKGGPTNMLNGAERCRTLWAISAELDDLNSDLGRLCISVSSYNFLDVWMAATLPYGIYSHKQIAETCLKQWKRRLFRYR